MNKLLLDDYPIVILPELACAVGLNGAIVLQQIHYWIEHNKKHKRNYFDGRFWVYNSYTKWQEQFPWWSDRTIQRVFTQLEKQGIILCGNYNKSKIDRTKWYSIDYDRLNKIVPLRQIGILEYDSMSEPIPETIAENTENGHNGENGAYPASAGCPRPDCVEHSDEDISDFMKWYSDYYAFIKRKRHPLIKSEQKRRVHDSLKYFCDENDVEIEELKEMARAFFDVASSDHNINHFATEGILTNRFYEAVF